MGKLSIALSVFVFAVFVAFVVGASEAQAGLGIPPPASILPGCSEIEGVDATTLVGGTCEAGTCTGGLCDDGVTGCTNSADCSDVCSNDNSTSCVDDSDCGDSFCGIIGRPGIDGVNKNGQPADNSDVDEDPPGDPYTDSLEMCINDALDGYCSTIFGAEDGAYFLFSIFPFGPNDNKRAFCVSFGSECFDSECSDHVDNEPAACVAGLCVNGGGTNGLGACTVDGDCDPGDGAIDFPDDPECMDYNDNDESVF